MDYRDFWSFDESETISFRDIWRPHKVINLLDMIKSLNLGQFAVGLALLKDARLSIAFLDKTGNQPILETGYNSRLRFVNDKLPLIEKYLSVIDLGDLRQDFQAISEFCILAAQEQSLNPILIGVILRGFDSIQDCIMRELRSRQCYIISRDSINFLDHSSLDSRQLAKIEKCKFDLIEARKSLAFGLNTACVYHCMCALEEVWPEIGDIAKGLGVKWDYQRFSNDGWMTLLTSFESAVKATENLNRNDKQRQQLKALSEISANMRSVKNAWRNPTMHARGPFSEDIAERVLEHTCGLLDYLASQKSI